MLTLLYTTPEGRNVYPLNIIFNEIKLTKLIIDNSHIKAEHPEIIDDEIYNLSLQLNGLIIDEGNEYHSGCTGDFEYFGLEPLFWNGEAYRLAFCLESGKNYLGITTCFKVRKQRKAKY